MKSELADECDYLREASFLKAFGTPEYLGNDPRFKVPWVWDGSTSTVLVMERISGVSVGEADALNLSREDRNDVSLFFWFDGFESITQQHFSTDLLLDY